MFKMSTSGQNSCPQPKSLPINHLINDCLPQLINISHLMLTNSLL